MSATDTQHQHTGPWVREGIDGRMYCQTCGPDWPGREHFPGGVYETPDTKRDERLRGIQERADAATEGPWEADHIDPSVWSPQIIVLGNYTAADGYDSPAWHDGTTTDRDFIAAARTDVPWLLAEVARLDAVVTAQAATIADLRGVAAREVEHRWMGQCPEDAYPDDRDEDCPACRALDEGAQ